MDNFLLLYNTFSHYLVAAMLLITAYLLFVNIIALIISYALGKPFPEEFEDQYCLYDYSKFERLGLFTKHVLNPWRVVDPLELLLSLSCLAMLTVFCLVAWPGLILFGIATYFRQQNISKKKMWEKLRE